MAYLNGNTQTRPVNSFVESQGTPSNVQGGNDLGIFQGLTNAPENGMKFDAFSIRITLVIVFCIIFLVAILVIFIVICLKRNNCVGRRNQNSRVRNGKSNYRNYDGSSSRPVSNGSDNSFMNENEDYLHGTSYSGNTPVSKASKKTFELRPHQPDIIEAEIHFVPSYHVYDYAYDHRMYGHSNEHGNQTLMCSKASAAPDINCYRSPNQSLLQSPVSYQEHQEANRRYFAHRSVEIPPQTAFSLHVSSPDDVSSPATGNDNGKYFQNTPLARLTPCSSTESPHHPVRILTLQDISRKQLQSIIIDSTSSSGGVSKEMGHSSSDMSWRNPIVHQPTIWTRTPGTTKDGSNIMRAVASKGIADFHVHDLVSHEIPPQDDQSSSSGSDDSFTGSEYDDVENKDDTTRHQFKNSTKLHHPTTSNTSVCVDLSETFPESFSALISCDERTSHNLSSSLQSFDCVLNPSFNFESFVDVFQDLANLPDLEHRRPSKKENVSNLSEIYV